MSFVLKPGQSGENIELLQQLLIDEGVLSVKDSTGRDNRDGRFGQITRDAVLTYQKREGLVPDGVVGEAAARSLGLELAPPETLPRVASERARPHQLLTQVQLHKLAEAVDALIPTGPVDLFDDVAIAWLVEKLDQTLAGLLPPNVAAYLSDLTKGLDEGDLGAFRKRLASAIGKQVNVPLLSEETEQRVIAFVVDLIVEGLRLGRNFDEALNRILVARD